MRKLMLFLALGIGSFSLVSPSLWAAELYVKADVAAFDPRACTNDFFTDQNKLLNDFLTQYQLSFTNFFPPNLTCNSKIVTAMHSEALLEGSSANVARALAGPAPQYQSAFSQFSYELREIKTMDVHYAIGSRFDLKKSVADVLSYRHVTSRSQADYVKAICNPDINNLIAALADSPRRTEALALIAAEGNKVALSCQFQMTFADGSVRDVMCPVAFDCGPRLRREP